MPEESFNITTQAALDENAQSLTVAGPPKRKRGRPPKIKTILANNAITIPDEEEIRCPKCNTDDPGDWSQCCGQCPMPESPHYDVAWLKANAAPVFINDPDKWGQWKTFNVTETSQVFLKWFMDCQKIALEGWELRLRTRKKFLAITMTKDGKTRPFAFVRKSTGNIHSPATAKDPFEHFVGNICDPETRLSVITPYGVEAHWEWLPTHPDYKESLAYPSLLDYDTDKNEDDEDGE